MTVKKLTSKQKILVAGTLFGMFFGAGNLIFPVHLGQIAGSNVIPAIIGFIVTAVGIPIFGVAAIGVTHSDGLQELSSKVSKGYGIFFTCLLYLTIGPLFAIPRCATVSFTTGLSPLVSDGAQSIALLIFSAIFFAFVLFFSLRPGKITVWIGKIINPIFLIFLAILVIAALIHPGASVASVAPTEAYATKTSAFFASFIEGYGTMDAIAGLAFGIVVIDVIRRMGSKAAARTLAQQAGVPVVPGSDGAVDTAEQARALADSIGYPVLIKASAGGGGRGMRRVYEPEQLIPLFEEARSESLACFGSGEMYLEKLIVNPRHIEFQIMADGQGHVIQLGDRDCSIQRRNQKLLEESPSKALTPELRERMGAAAVAAARAAGYVNAGTIEFVLAPDGQFYFIEMNTRIQVEHPVTELVTGLDLVREQIRVSAGLPLSVTQEEVLFRGHAIECRINAEDPAKGFQPCPGRIGFLHLPGGYGVRVDTGLYTGYELPPYYDSLMAKLIVYAPTRLEAIRRMRRALEELVIEGPATNTDLLHQILHHPDFVRGNYSTGFLEAHMDTLLAWSGSGEVREV